jgi:acyl-CoA synthetase (AMP-forming)/AMP-acid ligase II
VFGAHPDVDRVAVIGLPSEKWGEMVTAIVIARPGAVLTEQDLMAAARHRLAGFEMPKKIVFVDEMPETVGGKILKYKLRERFAHHASA